MHRMPLMFLSAAAAAAFAIPAVGAGADGGTRDRDRDRMPDRWEKQHQLKVAHDDARGDRDRDGLRNLAEFKAGLNPRDKDTDDDGIEDGAEDAGTIVSFTAGVLTLKTFDDETISGRVTSRTKIECEVENSATADADDDRHGRRGGHDDDDDGDRDEDDVEERDCGPEALVPGARVEEAKLVLTSAGRVWREIELELDK